ncbi:MAG: SDR family NAD(P)-dependent oxidoreductase [Chloroflexaceae bacterium]|nr:SDR family NAD(P)-dependent oxidoreductase [Chloroflexaceae bacterium]
MTRNTVPPSTVFVVSGGARGITAQCVIAMAQRYRCTFLLLGRSAATVSESAWVADTATEPEMQQQIIAHLVDQGNKPAPVQVQKILRSIQSEREIASTMAAISAAGGQAHYLQVDVTNGISLQDRLLPLMQQVGPVNGIIHGAGNLADKLIEQKSIDDFEHVYAVKITGLANILACIPLEQLHYLILFGSVVGFYGNPGQADYALANDIFNKAAHLFRRIKPSCRVVAINWGPWDGGMVTPALKQHFARNQIDIISSEAGPQMLLQELETPMPAVPQVIIGHTIALPMTMLASPPGNYRIRRQISLSVNPFLADHVIGDNAVLPAVFGMTWTANLCEQIYPGYTFFCIERCKVLKGIVFDETLADEYWIDLNETNRDDNTITVDALLWSQAENGRQRYHYRMQVILCRQMPDIPVLETFDLTQSHPIDGAQLYRDRTLFHGPCFQGVERVLNITEQRVTMLCRSPVVTAQQQGQFPLMSFNPYQADTQFQSLLIWSKHFYQAGCLPSQLQVAENFRQVPLGEPFYVTMDVQNVSSTQLTSDVISHDAEGRIYTRVYALQATMSSRLNQLFIKTSDQVV